MKIKCYNCGKLGHPISNSEYDDLVALTGHAPVYTCDDCVKLRVKNIGGVV